MNTTRDDFLKTMISICKHCGGSVALRNPSGKCDHLYWPDCLTDEARLANGYPVLPQTPKKGSA